MPRDVRAIEHSIEIAHWWPTAILHCSCVPGQAPVLLLIQQFGVPVQCPLCKKKATAIGAKVIDSTVVLDVIVTVESSIALN